MLRLIIKFGLSTSVPAHALEKISHILIRHYVLRRRIDYDYDCKDDDIDDRGVPSSMNGKLYSLAIFSRQEYSLLYREIFRSREN
jgi:hypothetical protein